MKNPDEIGWVNAAVTLWILRFAQNDSIAIGIHSPSIRSRFCGNIGVGFAPNERRWFAVIAPFVQ